MMSDTERERPGWIGRWARMVALAGMLAVGLAALTTGALPGNLAAALSAYNRLEACGLGASATMVANDAPALAYEQSQVSNGVPLGIFALSFQTDQQITFYDDLSRVASAPDPNSVKWKWDFGDGSDGYTYKSPHTYAQPGSYTVTVYIQDPVTGDWGDPFDHAVLNVSASEIANPPVAMAKAVSSSVIAMGSKITFDASGSHATVGSSLTYSWNFGDFSVATGQHVTHEFDQQGYGQVTLIVTDARGAKAIAQIPVFIIESLQPASFSVSPQNAPAGTTVNFDASKTTPPQGEPVAVAWDFGDGSPIEKLSTPTISHIYTKAGTYTVSVGIYGASDVVGSVAQQTVTVAAPVTTSPSASGGISWPLVGGIAALVVAAFIGLMVWQGRRQAAEERAAAAKREAVLLARARRVNPGAPGGRRAKPEPRDPRPPTRPGV